jgi:hypothetical protein
MTYDEAQRIAIDAGALEPHGMRESIARSIASNEDWSFTWSETPRAQARLQAWTQAVLDGVPAYDLKRRIG